MRLKLGRTAEAAADYAALLGGGFSLTQRQAAMAREKRVAATAEGAAAEAAPSEGVGEVELAALPHAEAEEETGDEEEVEEAAAAHPADALQVELAVVGTDRLHFAIRLFEGAGATAAAAAPPKAPPAVREPLSSQPPTLQASGPPRPRAQKRG